MPAAIDKNSIETLVVAIMIRSFVVIAEKIKNGKEREDATRKGISLTFIRETQISEAN